MRVYDDSSAGFTIVRGLAERLAAAAPYLLGDLPSDARTDDPSVRASALLGALIEAARPSGANPERWLLFVAVFGRYPGSSEFLRFARSLESDRPEVATQWLLAHALQGHGPYFDQGMRVVSDRPVAELSSSASADYVTGIQRVVRETLRRWSESHRFTPAMWHETDWGLRSLSVTEMRRLQLHGPQAQEPPIDSLIVPFRTDVLFLDAPDGRKADAWACMARFSGNRVSHVGYDLIPISSADLRSHGEAGNSAAYLSVIKHSHKVACISDTTRREFAGVARAFPAQGLKGPLVGSVPLPEVGAVDASAITKRVRTDGEPVVILCPGTRELHKNHETILWAAERLWREGLDFELHFMGRMGIDFASFKDVESKLIAKGRPIIDLGLVTDETLWKELKSADAVVFISLQEGFGLPVVEALSVGTPVLTTEYGSQGEIGRLGGCLLVDPRDDVAVTDALRRLVGEPALREELRAQIAERPRRRWDDYATDLWDFFIESETAVAS
ncbi:glycosyltransferase [Microbacterium sp. BWT-B31]|uniref:glycosyltransferase n=1 Tax=Microbacterium sp. BWT-B31 TaxID=3232072 RepID=UPI003528A7AD